MAVYVIILSIILVTTHIGSNQLAYAQDSISITCGPIQQSNLSVSMSVDGFLPETFINYKFVRPDNSVVYGGFSTWPHGKNTVAINVGPDTGSYLLYIYKDTNSPGHGAAPSIQFNYNVTLPR